MNRILIIEDDPMIQESLAELLSLAGYELATAQNGKLALAEALLFQPDLVVCDVMMPEMDGYSFIQVLRSVPQFAALPFIFLTALVEPADFRKGMNLGADDYLTKPFAPQELLAVIQQKLDRQEQAKKAKNKLHAQLEAAQNKVQQLQFFNSHQLRGPISNILGLLQQSEAFDQEELLQMLQTEAKKVDDVLGEISQQLHPGTTNKACRIYLIDDDSLQHRLNEHLIARTNPEAEIQHFYNGFEAIAAYQDPLEPKPDLIFLDLNMPVMNGLECLRAFEQLEPLPRLFVLSSSISQREIDLVTQHSFVEGFLHKPLQVEQLIQIFQHNA